MTEPISSPSYWAARLRQAKRGDLHTAIFRCPLDRWLKIEDRHREILAEHIQSNDSVIDIGCGWGRLLSLMPSWWDGSYFGIDLSPDFIAMAKERWADSKNVTTFACSPIGDGLPTLLENQFDVAIMVSFRPMVRRNLGDEAWEGMEREIRRVSKRRLYLEYNLEDWSAE